MTTVSGKKVKFGSYAQMQLFNQCRYPPQTVNTDSVHNSSDGCCLFDHCTGSNV